MIIFNQFACILQSASNVDTYAFHILKYTKCIAAIKKTTTANVFTAMYLLLILFFTLKFVNGILFEGI